MRPTLVLLLPRRPRRPGPAGSRRCGPAGPHDLRPEDVVEGLANKLAKNYVFPDVAQKTGEALKAKLAKGGYDGAGTRKAFMELLSEDLRTFGNDRHFRVGFDPKFKEDEDDDRPPTAKEREEGRAISARRGSASPRRRSCRAMSDFWTSAASAPRNSWARPSARP